MRDESPTRAELLDDVHKVAAEAAWWRARALKVMAKARRAGATDQELAEASGLSINAVHAWLDPSPGHHPADQRPQTAKAEQRGSA